MKKKLIMILCAVVSLSLAACGGTVETDSDSRTEREVEDDDEDRDKEDKDKSDSGKSLFSKLKKSESIIEEVSLYETTLADVEGYLDDKGIIFDSTESQIVTQTCNDFLGYDCYYDINFQEVVTLVDKYETKSHTLDTKEDYLQFALNSLNHWGVVTGDYFDEKYPDLSHHTAEEDSEDKSRISSIRIKVGNTSQEAFVESGKKITSYLKEKSDTLDEYEVYWDTEEDITYYPIKEVKEGDLECVEYISFEERHYEGEPEGGYINAAYVMYYKIVLKEYWNNSIITSNSDVTTETEAKVEISASDSEATASSTQTETPASDSASTTTVQESKEEEPVILDKFEIATDFKTLEGVDVESEVATIRDYYYATQNNLGNYMLEEHQNLTMYHEAGYPVKIFVKSGYNDWDYTREYFYHDQELYFAFVYNNNEQHRLYFKDGIMIRYIDENGNTFDYGNLNEFYSWEYMSLYDSYNIYPTMPNCGA